MPFFTDRTNIEQHLLKLALILMKKTHYLLHPSTVGFAESIISIQFSLKRNLPFI